MSYIKISVIIPIFKVERYIESCLRSLFTQTLTDGVEYILVNDCTPDKSMEIVEGLLLEFPHLPVRIINKEKNEGLAAARISGLKIAKGEYIQHIDSDDWCEPTMLEEMYNKAIEENADIVGADFFINYKNKQIYKENTLLPENIPNLDSLMLGKIHGGLWSKLIKKSLYNDDIMKSSEGLNMWEDLLASVKLFYYAKSIIYLPQAFVHYRQRSSSVVYKAQQHKMPDYVYVINEIESFCKKKNISRKLEKGLDELKIGLKYNFAINTRGKIRKEYLKMYPEANDKIRESRLSAKQQFALLAAARGHYFLTDIITLCNNSYTALKKLVKKIIGWKVYELY